jgi:hypothetical protein
MKSTVRKNIELIKEQKERREVGKLLAESRIRAIANDENFFANLKEMEESKRLSLTFMMLNEMSLMYESEYISEQDFFSGMKSVLGLGMDTAIEQIFESLLMSVFETLGIEKWWLSRMTTSILATNPRELVKALRGDCKTLTTLIAESMVEAMVIGYQQDNQKVSGVFFDFFRNLIGNALKKTETVKSVENMISGTVCGLFSKAKEAITT